MAQLKLAAIVSVYNEKVFLPNFLDHYSTEVDRIYVLDNESTDGSTEICKKYPNVELSSYSSKGLFNDELKHDTLMEKRRSLAEEYDYTLVLDADEIVVPKAKGSIKAMIEKTKRLELYGTDGWNIYGYPFNKPYDPARPILDQRKHGQPNEYYSKPVIGRSSVPFKYVHGCHYIKPGGSTIVRPAGTHFWMFHLRGFDEEIFIKRSLDRSKRMSREWNGHYYWNATEADFRGRIAHERVATTVTKVVPEDLAAYRSAQPA